MSLFCDVKATVKSVVIISDIIVIRLHICAKQVSSLVESIYIEFEAFREHTFL